MPANDASAARAIRDFFMQVSPRLNRGLRCEGVTKCRHSCAPAGSPGQPPFGKVGGIAPEGLFFRKVFSLSESDSLHPDNRKQWLSGPHATSPVFVSDSENPCVKTLDA